MNNMTVEAAELIAMCMRLNPDEVGGWGGGRDSLGDATETFAGDERVHSSTCQLQQTCRSYSLPQA